ncbi:protein phosphatase 1 regulatory subunit 15A [Otolemur garnettii]|uniref:protein phosphatase 1 regulatory subunit 15A n=1 Tax=Otolemur garnettii TaxID=30611 RepID=UPI000C7EBA30|nr:protein phosphatase 1 regulatory subunit 15A [Otolemur garnettii]
MAPGQVPHQAAPWRDSHNIFLLSPLMGFLSRTWSRLRGPGPPEPWLMEGVIEVGQTEAGLEGEAKAPPATHHAPGGKHSQGEGEDRRTCEEVEEVANLKTSYSLLEAWGLSDDDSGEDSEEEATSAAKEQGCEFPDGQPSTLSPNLLIRTLQGSDKNPGEEETEEGVTVDEGVTKFSYPSSHWECFPVVEGKEDAEAVKNEAPRTSLLCPRSKLSTWVYCPGEEDQATEEERRTESKKAKKTSISPSPSSSNPKALEYCSGKECEGKDEKALKEASDPNLHSLVRAQRSLLKSWEYHPRKYTEEGEDNVGAAEKERGTESPSSVSPPSVSLKAWAYQTGEDTKEEEDEEEDNDLGEAEASSSISPTSAFLKTWVYRPGEDTEEEDDSDSESAEEEGEGKATCAASTGAFLKFWAHQTGEDTEEEEEEDNDLGEAEASSSISPISAFLKTWVYRPGEDTEEDENSDSELVEEEGEADILSSTSSTGAFLKAWVYRPGEDTEDEDERNEDKGYDSKVVGEEGDSDPSLQSQSALLRGWVCRPEKETEEQKAAKKWGEAEPCPFRVAIYLPGEKPPPPWAPPKLPLRLQKRLKFSETPTWDPDPETPLRGRKVRFSEKVTVHLLAVWAGPAQAARRGPWEQFARDRSRFQRRITQAQEELGPCLTPAARARAWTRLGNPLPALDSILAPTQTLPSSSVSSEAPFGPYP